MIHIHLLLTATREQAYYSDLWRKNEFLIHCLEYSVRHWFPIHQSLSLRLIEYLKVKTYEHHYLVSIGFYFWERGERNDQR